jgi:small-conductance mechanosensitive channel
MVSALVGLSWLIGSSLHDILTCIIFLFVLHPFDVGDKISLGKDASYTVKEIRLLSTILLDGHGTCVQVSNIVLSSAVRLVDVRHADQLTLSLSSFKIFAEALRHVLSSVIARLG